MLEVREAHMDERIEQFLRDVLHLEGETPARVREGVRFAIAVYERMFREAEPDDRKKDEAAKKCRTLCRERVVEAIERHKGTPTEAHLQIVLRVLDGSARFPLKD